MHISIIRWSWGFINVVHIPEKNSEYTIGNNQKILKGKPSTIQQLHLIVDFMSEGLERRKFAIGVLSIQVQHLIVLGVKLFSSNYKHCYLNPTAWLSSLFLKTAIQKYENKTLSLLCILLKMVFIKEKSSLFCKPSIQPSSAFKLHFLATYAVDTADIYLK